MNGEVRIDVSGLDLAGLVAAVDAVQEVALGAAMEHVRGVAAGDTPVETGRLVGTASVHVDGDTASITYDGPYARYQHERLDLHHEHGKAKFLELAAASETGKACEIIAGQIRGAL